MTEKNKQTNIQTKKGKTKPKSSKDLRLTETEMVINFELTNIFLMDRLESNRK